MPLREIAPSVANDTVSMSQSQRASASQREEDEESRRQLKMHAEFQKQIEDKQAELVNPQNGALAKKLGDADELLDGTTNTRELNRNTAIFCQLTEMGVEQAKRLEKNLSKFTADAYVKKLKRRYCDDEDDVGEDDEDAGGAADVDRVRRSFDWAALGQVGFSVFNSAPTVDFMTGPMALKPKERKVAKRAKKVVLGQQTKVQNVEDTAAENEEHTKLMTTVSSELRRKDHPSRPEGTDYQLFWPFVLEPTLGDTVLRIFATCHAARERYLSLSLNSKDEDGRLKTPAHPEGELLIGPPRKLAAQGGGVGNEEDEASLQFIMSIDMALYKAKMAEYKDHVKTRRQA